MFYDCSESSDVTQTPRLWVPQGESAQMDCNHTKGVTYFYMHWFRQQEEDLIKLLIAFTTINQNPDFGEFLIINTQLIRLCFLPCVSGKTEQVFRQVLMIMKLC